MDQSFGRGQILFLLGSLAASLKQRPLEKERHCISGAERGISGASLRTRRWHRDP